MTQEKKSLKNHLMLKMKSQSNNLKNQLKKQAKAIFFRIYLLRKRLISNNKYQNNLKMKFKNIRAVAKAVKCKFKYHLAILHLETNPYRPISYQISAIIKITKSSKILPRIPFKININSKKRNWKQVRLQRIRITNRKRII